VDDLQKLALLSSASRMEAGEDGCRMASGVCKQGIVLTQAKLPNGKTTTLLKSLLSSFCENDCLYCCFRSGRDIRRSSYQPEEFARTVLNLTNAGLIQGVFLSSGIAGGGVRTQDRLIAAAEVLRRKFDYHGYLHLKIMPGAEYDQVLASMRLADRVSINLEAPNAERLPLLAPRKHFLPELLTPLRWISDIRRNSPAAPGWKNRWPSSCTQFVVGGAGESDQELLDTSQTLHRRYGLLRVYYSALKPEFDTPLENHAPIPLRRELRLYQADYLIRDYGFSRDELIFDLDENLILDRDPKRCWADRHLSQQPVEINRASREELLRVPGIGPKAALAILKARRLHTLRDLSSLEKLGIRTQRIRDFIPGRSSTGQTTQPVCVRITPAIFITFVYNSIESLLRDNMTTPEENAA
jgi:predicted DNA-binding helix-hairpin-helix protein